MSVWKIHNVEQFLEPHGARNELVVVLHRFGGSRAEMDGVVGAIAAARPDADVFVPELPYAGFWGRLTMSPAAEIAATLTDAIDALIKSRARDKGEYSHILIVGHSFGSVLARKIVILANGETDGVPFEGGVDRFHQARSWARTVTRIVLLAGMSGGWAVSSVMTWKQTLLWGCGSFVGDVLFLGRWTIFALRKGAPFLVQTRLQWLALMRRADPPPVIVVQLLGTIDDLVAPDDNIDFAVDFNGNFRLIEVRQTGHFEAITMTAPNGSADKAAASHRREMFTVALNDIGLVDEKLTKLEDVAIPRSYMADSLPPEPNDKVTDVVFVIHGIRDQGYWTQKIARTIKRQAAERHQDFRSVTASYGYFAMAPFLLPWVRRRKVAWLMDRYSEACAHYPNAEFSYVGHSNGTYLVARALRDYLAAKFKRIALAGSVVRSDYDWLGLIETGSISRRTGSRVESVLNYVATNDKVVAVFPNGLEPTPVFDLGGAGHKGFTQGNDLGPVHQVKFIKGSHGAGHQEEHWNEIAAFIVDGTIPGGDAFVQDQLCRRLGKASTSIVFSLFFLLLGLSLFSVALILTSPAGVLFAAMFLWAAYFVLSRL